MKQLLIILLCFVTLNAGAQTAGTKELNIYSNNGRAVIGKLIVNTAAESKLFLLTATQRKDSSNHYITTFYFGNKEKTPLSSVKILMKFSKPVVGVSPSYSMAFNNVKGISDDHTAYFFKAGPLNRDPGSVVVISFVIKSKDKISTEITGLDGVK